MAISSDNLVMKQLSKQTQYLCRKLIQNNVSNQAGFPSSLMPRKPRLPHRRWYHRRRDLHFPEKEWEGIRRSRGRQEFSIWKSKIVSILTRKRFNTLQIYSLWVVSGTGNIYSSMKIKKYCYLNWPSCKKRCWKQIRYKVFIFKSALYVSAVLM